MLKSEKKSFIRFLLIYLGSTLLLFSLASYMFYNYEKQHLLDTQRETLKYKAEQIKSQLRVLHNTFDAKLTYPTFLLFDSAIYDSNKNYIMGTFKKQKTIGNDCYFNNEQKLYHVSNVEPYYLGAVYLLVSKDINTTPMDNLKKNILWFMFAAAIFFGILGMLLGRLFIAPMRETVEKMNRFIQDTTHELNTPISTILNNIEILETFGKGEESIELNRIQIASQTLSRIYDDLTYLSFNHQYHRDIQLINISTVLNERLLYFSASAEVRDLTMESNIQENVMLDIDNNDLMRIIDNLISNAIKYNKHAGNISIELTEEYLRISDKGKGISASDLKFILQRFKRADNSEGGFGIGLDIVNQVVITYGFTLHINSVLGEGTEMEIRW